MDMELTQNFLRGKNPCAMGYRWFVRNNLGGGAALSLLLLLPTLTAEPIPCERTMAMYMPGRKQGQIEAFTGCLPPHQGPYLEWCAGKGHLGRLVSLHRGAEILSLEWQGALCEDGRRLAARDGAAQVVLERDARADLGLHGGGIDGTVHLAPQDGAQAIKALLLARNAKFGGDKPIAIGNAKRVRSLGELLAASDIVSLHVDGRAANKGFFGRAQMEQMKKGSILINLSRGHIVDIEALCEKLADGTISGAGIDGGDAHMPAPQSAQVIQLLTDPGKVLFPVIGRMQQQLPGGGQPQPGGMALEERHRQLLFHAQNLTVDRGR